MLPKGSLQVLKGAKSFPIRVHVVDRADGVTGSGVAKVEVRLTGALSSRRPTFHLASGTTNDGVWVANVSLSPRVPAGKYKISSLTAVDAAGNSATAGEWGYGVPAGLNGTVTVTGKEASAIPAPLHVGRLESFAMTPNPVSATKAGAKVTVTAKYANPQPTGLKALFTYPTGETAVDSSVKFSRQTSGAWRATYEPHPGMGTSSNVTVTLFDSGRIMNSSSHKTLVVKGDADTTGPTVTAFSASTSTVDTTSKAATVTFHATVTDSGGAPGTPSGVYAVGVTTAPQTADPSPYVNDTFTAEFTRVGTTDQYTGTLTVPACTPGNTLNLTVGAADYAANETALTGTDLTSLGEAAAIDDTSTSTVADQIYPTFTGATASSSTGVITAMFSEPVKNLTIHNLFLQNRHANEHVTVTGVTCLDSSQATTACDGTGNPVVSVEIATPGLTKGEGLRLIANANSITPQAADLTGNPIDWDCASDHTDQSESDICAQGFYFYAG